MLIADMLDNSMNSNTGIQSAKTISSNEMGGVIIKRQTTTSIVNAVMEEIKGPTT